MFEEICMIGSYSVGFWADRKDRKKEHFVALFRNARYQVVCREDVSVGSLNASMVHPREARFIGRDWGGHS